TPPPRNPDVCTITVSRFAARRRSCRCNRHHSRSQMTVTRRVREPLPPFQHLLDDFAGDVLRFLVAQVGMPDADDCFQETFIAALRSYPTLRDASNLRGWLLTIARRKAIDSRRAASRRPLLVDSIRE